MGAVAVEAVIRGRFTKAKQVPMATTTTTTMATGAATHADAKKFLVFLAHPFWDTPTAE